MTFIVEKSVGPAHLKLTVDGVYSFTYLFDLIDLMKSEARAASRTKILVDCRGLEGKMTEAERFQGGQRIAQVLGSRIQAAIVMPAGEVTKLGEIAARNRGAHLLVTESIGEAEAWLDG